MAGYLNKTASLTPLAKRIICDKTTEYPHSGTYNLPVSNGSYLCRRCGLALFRASSQFASGCGWPSFDRDIAPAVKKIPDADGERMEIVCSRCDAHLGHVFVGEFLTNNNIRYCVNSASLDFVSESNVTDSQEAIVAGGCFWGVEYYFRQMSGVLKVESGYIGGYTKNPTYNQICQGNTGHYEAVRVVYDPNQLSYHDVIKRFFEIHDPTQEAGQGPDQGAQYQSAVFFYNDEQWNEIMALMALLKKRGYIPATRLIEVSTFWPAEPYHQDYYNKQQKLPYCHRPVNRFGDN